MDIELRNSIESAAIGFWVIYNYNNRNNNIEWLDLLKILDYNDNEVVQARHNANLNNISP